MGDSEASVAEASATVAEYAQAGYTSSVYVDATLNVGHESGVFPGAVASDGAYAAHAYGTEANPALQDAHIGTAYESESVIGIGSTGDIVSSAENTSVVASQAAGYSSSVNGNVGMGVGSATTVENGIAESIPSGAGSDGSALSGEEDRLWSIVKTNPLDFDAWTALIEETEKMAGEKIWKIRTVYDSFLAEFPLCYGYWKKYADHEARLGSMDKVVEVYERAVLGVTYSVDIWLHYCTFSISTYGDPDTIRRLFERALAYVGTDYLCYPLWDKYIEYEEMQSEWSRVAILYTRILEIPNRRLDDYLNRFKALAASRPLSELRTSEEAAAAAELPAPSQHVDQENEGEVHPNTAEQASNSVSAGLTEAEELEKYIAIREEIYKKAKEFDSKISDFENAIRRPYFHVRPLNIAELENWHNYLDFIEREGDINKVVKLYERCLIACANYPDYWIRYVLCMEAFESMDLANNALARATQAFVKRQPDIHLFAARFGEKNGDVPGARAAYQLIHTQIAPGLLDAIVKHANMEHRHGKIEDAFSIYDQAIAIEKGKENSQSLPILYAQYSRFSHLVCGNQEKAREILSEAIENVQLSKPILEAIIHFESIQSLPRRIDYLDSLVEKFISPSSDNLHGAAEKEELSCIFLEFLDMFGDAQSLKKAEDRHSKLFLPYRSRTDLKKRHAEDYLASDKSKLAKSYTDGTAPAQSLMGAYPSAQNQWTAGYGTQPQAWPPATQAPLQPWTTGYGQQAAYGAYGGYASSYSTPQGTTSVPQAATYGGYPSTYPAQALPQQGYTQPTAAAAAVAVAPAPAQQPAAVPQPYYGSYY